MKRLLITLATLLAFVSCSDSSLAHVFFNSNQALSKSITGYISLPETESLYWIITATKLDDGDRIGEGKTEYDTKGLADKSIMLSTGRWKFDLIGKDDYKEMLKGSAEADLIKGENTVPITLRTDSNHGGTLRVVAEVDGVDGMNLQIFDADRDEVVKSGTFANGRCDLTTSPSAGLHSYAFRIVEFGLLKQEWTSNVRILGNCTTMVEISTEQGNALFQITIENSAWNE